MNQHWTLPLQCLALGLALGDKEFRASLETTDFLNPDFRGALSELNKGGPYCYLQRVLQECGADWRNDGNLPADAIHESMRRTTAYVEAMRIVLDVGESAEQSFARDHQEVIFEKLKELEAIWPTKNES